MAEEKRKGYKTSSQQVEANKRYLANNPGAKEKQKKASCKSSAKRFIKNYADKSELLELIELINEKMENL